MRRLPPAFSATLHKAAMERLLIKPKASKYRAVPTVVDGIRFDSKAEAEYFKWLKIHRLQFIRQPIFDLPGGVKYRADFLVYSTYGGDPVEVIDIKGHDTPVSKLKRKQVEAIHGVTISVLKAVYQRGVITSFEEVSE